MGADPVGTSDFEWNRAMEQFIHAVFLHGCMQGAAEQCRSDMFFMMFLGIMLCLTMIFIGIVSRDWHGAFWLFAQTYMLLIVLGGLRWHELKQHQNNYLKQIDVVRDYAIKLSVMKDA